MVWGLSIRLASILGHSRARAFCAMRSPHTLKALSKKTASNDQPWAWFHCASLGEYEQTTSAPSLSIPHYPYADFSHPHPTTSSSLQQLNTRSGQNSYFSSQHHQSPLTFLRLTSSPAQLNFVPLHLAASYSRHGHASLASSPNLNPPPPF
jgi:hypothetical protein